MTFSTQVNFNNKNITALVPCFNEAERIGRVLDALSKSRYIHKIIVIDDGSTDETKKILQKYENIKVVKVNENTGKGNAIRRGISNVNTPFVLLCDADLVGLKDSEIRKMTEPVTTGQSDVCVGVRYRGGKFIQFLRRNVFPLIAGERVLKADILREISKSPLFDGWGVEIYMNFFARKNKLRMIKIDLMGVIDPLQIQKRGFITFFKRLFTLAKIYWDVYTHRE